MCVQIEAMETKVSALNNLLHTKPTPSFSSPNTHHKHKKPSVKKMIRKMSRKTSKKIAEHKEVEGPLKHGEIQTEDYGAFVEWLEKGLPFSEGENSFFSYIHSSQIAPCLKFKNEQVICIIFYIYI